MKQKALITRITPWLFLCALLSIFGTDTLNGQSVGIGINNPGAKLHVVNGTSAMTMRLKNEGTGPAVTYGILNDNLSTGAGKKYAIFNRTFGAGGLQPIYGTSNQIFPADNGMDAYAGYFEVDSAGTGTHYGVYSKVVGAGNYALYGDNPFSDGYAAYLNGRAYIANRLGIGTEDPEHKLHILNSGKRGILIESDHASTDTAWGIFNQILPGGTGVRVGMLSNVILDPAHAERAYGIRTTVEDNGNDQHWGVLARADGDDNIGVEGVSSGTGIGVRGKNTDNTGWAGYFEGNAYILDRLEVRDKIFLRPVGNGSGGEIELFDDDGDQTVTIRAGQSTTNGAEMLLYNDAGELTIELDADFNSGNGRVITSELQITGGADLAELFEMHSEEEWQRGTLVSVDPNGSAKLLPTTAAYDRNVIGVISGANGVHPGVLLGQETSPVEGDTPIALAGRVYVLADATQHPIHPGDLLTSSNMPGYAMGVKNRKKARGATIGKALTALESGTGYVLLLVNLQ